MSRHSAPARLLVHPIRRCNLECRHCFSESGPRAADQLDIATLRGLLEDAAELGYGRVHVSGGEPFLYRELPALLAHARAAAFTISVVTNGLLVGDAPIDELAGLLDDVSVSIDGAAGYHDQLRGQIGAHRAALLGLRNLCLNGVFAGVQFTLTAANAGQITEVAEQTADCGASYVRIVPLRVLGRALSMLDEVPSIEQLQASLELAERLTEQRPSCQVTVEAWRAHDDGAFRTGHATEQNGHADAYGDIVVEADGLVTPVSTGVPRSFALGNLKDAPLSALAFRWRASEAGLAFGRALRTAAQVVRLEEGPFLWDNLVADLLR